ncbi:helix-turn-helix domain-containing protein [Bacillus sp. V5-8f]|uniref:helix-turn-helix domain-containing protein n=1 Tax=Bacillus sp. V5-8f TaxID=2053044 RepID=UPI000C783F25|nr:helix-turn-helix domain-containing protein [Bacillus sp. V5-8f]PLT32526.1 hypothetical protein CUU64_18650 [Bacillus sp. V5-8f]
MFNPLRVDYYYDVGYLSDPKRKENIEILLQEFNEYGVSNIEINAIQLYSVRFSITLNNEEECEDFIYRFEKTETYKKSRDYQDSYLSDVDDLRIALAGKKKWTVNNVETILKSRGGWWNNTLPTAWYTITALINLGAIIVKEIHYESVPLPIFNDYPYYSDGGGSELHQFIKWQAFNKLRELSGDSPTPSYSTHFFSDKIQTYSKAGELDPYQVVSILDENQSHIHFPIDIENYYYHFSQSEKYIDIRKDEVGIVEEINRIIGEENSNNEEKRKISEWRNLEELKLENYIDNYLLNTTQTAKILEKYTSHSFNADKIRNLINKGSIKGTKNNLKWHVEKSEIERYLNMFKQ